MNGFNEIMEKLGKFQATSALANGETFIKIFIKNGYSKEGRLS